MKHLLTAPNADDPYLFPFRPIYDPKRGMDQFSQECLPELQDDPAYARVIVEHFYSLEDLSNELVSRVRYTLFEIPTPDFFQVRDRGFRKTNGGGRHYSVT